MKNQIQTASEVKNSIRARTLAHETRKKSAIAVRIIFCIAFLCSGYLAQAQCRFIAPDAEEWIENNREKIAKMTRPEWQELGEGYKWRVFIELSAKQKHDLFRLKIKQVRDCFEWNKEEAEHIEKLYQLFVDNPDMYSEERDEKKEAEIQEITEKWVTHAMEELKWTIELIQGIVLTPEDLLDKSGKVRMTESTNEDEFVEQWLKSNLDEILQLREYFKNTFNDHNHAQNEYDNFTPFQKQALWAGKLREVLELEWTEPERQHIQSLLEFMIVNPIIFSDERDSDDVLKALEMANNWSENWGLYAFEKLGWDHNLLFAMVETLGVMHENKDVAPKFKQPVYIMVDGVQVPHVLIDGVHVRLDSLE